jgi:hypothetical protein
MSVGVNDILAVTYRYTVTGQTCLMNLHYRVTAAPGSGTNFANEGQLAEKMQDPAGTVLSKLLPCLASEVIVNEVRVQRVYPFRDIYAARLIGLAGTHPEPTPAEACTHFPFEKRTAKPGRKGIGSLHLSGVPGARKTGNIWTALASEFSDLASALVQSISMTSPAWSVTPCLYNPTDASLKYADLLEVLPLYEIRTSNRRVGGRGI